MNAPARHELVYLPDGVNKVYFQKDTKIPNAATFFIQLEDHTLGNLLRSQLAEHQNVLFTGYRMPHPLEHNIELKIQVKRGFQPEVVFNEAINALIVETNSLRNQFKIELQKFQQ